MEQLNNSLIKRKKLTNKVIQFGEGNFLRAFVDWMIDKANEKVGFDAGVIVVQPIEQGLADVLNKQDGLYTLYSRGIKNSKPVSEHKIIDCIQQTLSPYTQHQKYLKLADDTNIRYIISNTTEAGISYNSKDALQDTPPKSFPAKLTQLLYRRYKTFKGDANKGFIILPCELIEENGENLKKIVLQYAEKWNLEENFFQWIEKANTFCNTLVDRIVPGYPKERIAEITQELGYEDKLVVEGEQFHLWVIEAPEKVKEEFPLDRCGLNVIFTDDLTPYRTRKVRILNGAHTVMVPVAYLSGVETVRETVEHPILGEYVKQVIFEEIIPTLHLSEEELKTFANDVLDRFRNPYVKHYLASISLNSISKFKARVLPSLKKYVGKTGTLPKRIVFSLSCLILFYKGEYSTKQIPLNDDKEVITFFKNQWLQYERKEIEIYKLVENVLANRTLWGDNLNTINQLKETITKNIQQIQNNKILHLLQTVQAV